MFGVSAISEVGFSETKDIEAAVFVGSVPVMYFNSSTLTFPLSINKIADFSLDINKLQNHSLTVNKIVNFTTRR